jgi:hypothetical protein
MDESALVLAILGEHFRTPLWGRSRCNFDGERWPCKVRRFVLTYERLAHEAEQLVRRFDELAREYEVVPA